MRWYGRVHKLCNILNVKVFGTCIILAVHLIPRKLANYHDDEILKYTGYIEYFIHHIQSSNHKDQV